jgi:cation diffusion facilitator family transporter
MGSTAVFDTVHRHSHVFLGDRHAVAERRTWTVIWLCTAMMALEIGGGLLFGSIALVADGLHMSTHAGALLLAALAYTYARQHAEDPRFTFGTGKLGDLAGFSSAVVLAMIALLIAYEAVTRLLAPVPIRFGEAIPIAILGLAVNAGSAWLLGGGGGHYHHPGHAHDHSGHDEAHRIATPYGEVALSVFEDGVPPVFRLRATAPLILSQPVTIETERPGGAHQLFEMASRGDYLESTQDIPEPHAFIAHIAIGGVRHDVTFEEHDHGAIGRDNNMRAAVIHVMADAAVSVLVIVGLVLARLFGWVWMDPLAGLVGAGVIASWSYGLIRDTGAVLLDMTPDHAVADAVRRAIESEGDRLADLHVWRLGPGHLAAIVSVVTLQPREAPFYRARLARIRALSHLTIEVQHDFQPIAG